MQNKFLLLIVIIFSVLQAGCGNRNISKISIIFENNPTLNQEIELINLLDQQFSYKELKTFVKDQNWIETYLIRRYPPNSIQIYIRSRKPQYVWRDHFYLTSDLSKFSYDGGYPELIRLNVPIDLVDQWVNVEQKFKVLLRDYNFEIVLVNFQTSEGWYLLTKNNLRINIGSEFSSEVYKKLLLTLKYMFENNLTPSIIDLRYKEGAALNYGK